MSRILALQKLTEQGTQANSNGDAYGSSCSWVQCAACSTNSFTGCSGL